MALVEWKDLATAITGGLSSSSNPYLSTAGGLLGGGGGTGGVVQATPPPPPPVPPNIGGGNLGALAPSLPWIVGGIMLLIVGGLAFGVRGSR